MPIATRMLILRSFFSTSRWPANEIITTLKTPALSCTLTLSALSNHLQNTTKFSTSNKSWYIQQSPHFALPRLLSFSGVSALILDIFDFRGFLTGACNFGAYFLTFFDLWCRRRSSRFLGCSHLFLSSVFLSLLRSSNKLTLGVPAEQ